MMNFLDKTSGGNGAKTRIEGKQHTIHIAGDVVVQGSKKELDSFLNKAENKTYDNSKPKVPSVVMREHGNAHLCEAGTFVAEVATVCPYAQYYSTPNDQLTVFDYWKIVACKCGGNCGFCEDPTHRSFANGVYMDCMDISSVQRAAYTVMDRYRASRQRKETASNEEWESEHKNYDQTKPKQPAVKFVEAAFGEEEEYPVLGEAENKVSLEHITNRAVFATEPDAKAFKPEFCSDRVALDVALNPIMNNLVHITQGDLSIQGIMLRGLLMIVPYHLYPCIDQEKPVHLHSVAMNTDLSFSRYKLKEFKEGVQVDKDTIVFDPKRDFMCIPLPSSCSFAMDVSKHFCDLESLSKNHLFHALTMSYTHSRGKVIPVIKLLGDLKFDNNIHYTLEFGNVIKKFVLADSLMYTGATTYGDCGGPVIALNSSLERKIVGFHTFGSENKGGASLLTRKFLDSVVSVFPETCVPSIKSPILPTNVAQIGRSLIKPGDNTQYIGEVEPSLQFRVPGQSEIGKSPFYGLFEPLTAPAVLSPATVNGERINPVRKQIEQQFVDRIMFPEETVDVAVKHLEQHINSLNSDYKKMERKILTDEENLNGIPGFDFISSMNMKTSPGYPYVLARKRPGKFDLVNLVDDRYELTPEAKANIDRREQELRENIIEPVIWADCLKDERRPLDKVAAVNTRVFNTGPFDINYLIRKYFLNFMAHCMANAAEGEISAGINPHSGDWGRVFKRLKRFSRNAQGARERFLIAGDYSKYDKRLPFSIIIKCLRVIQNYYNDEHYLIRQNLFIATFNAMHIAGTSVYRCSMGNPSGCAITTVINSMVNSCLIRIAYVELGKSAIPPRGIEHFHDDVEFLSYGDDNLGSVSEDAWFLNMNTYANFLAKFGVKYTSATKEDTFLDYCTLEEVSYLKRHFVVHDSYVYAPLFIDSISEMMMWYKKKGHHSLNELMRDTFRSFQQELIHHPESVFNEMRDKVLRRAQELGIQLDIVDYHESRRNMILGNV